MPREAACDYTPHVKMGHSRVRGEVKHSRGKRKGNGEGIVFLGDVG